MSESVNAAVPPPAAAGLPPRPNPGRLPSLTQLAARISERSPTVGQGGANSNSPSSASRPRLPTSLLARTSSSGQPPTNTTPASAATHTAAAAADEASAAAPAVVVTAAGAPSQQDHHAEEEPVTKDSKPAPRGYKNVPSLEAITERLAMVRAKSSEQTAQLPQASPANETSSKDKENESGVEAPPATAVSPTSEPPSATTLNEDTKDADSSEDGRDHPLQHTWTMYHDCKSARPAPAPTPDASQPAGYVPPPSTNSWEYEAGLTVIGEFNTVEGFCRYFNWLKPPSQLEKNSNYHLFKDGIKPMWEDEANANGGKWVLTMKNNPQLLDRCWTWLAMGLVGEELDERDEVCGAVVSLRPKIDRIQLWLRSKDDVERINSIGKKMVKLLDVGNEPGVGLEFQYNTDDRPTHTKFISIVPQHPSGFFRPRYAPAPGQDGNVESQSATNPPASAPGPGGFGGGMGSFSTGGSAWRSGGSGRSNMGAPVGTRGSAFGAFGGGVGGGVSLGITRESSGGSGGPNGGGGVHGRSTSLSGSGA